MIGVLGASGFIGRNLVAHLAASGIPARAISRRISSELLHAADSRIECIQADLADQFQTAAAIVGLRAVVNLASVSSPGLRNDYVLSDIAANVVPQVRFLQDCLNAGIRKVIFLSSGGTVYGVPRYLPIDEEHPTDPINSHGLTKLAVEKYLGLYRHAHGLDFTVLRVSNAFGPHQSFRLGQGLIPLLRERCLSGEPIDVFGDGSACRDYVYVADVVRAILMALDEPNADGEVINIGSGTGHTVLEIIAAVERVLNRRIEIRRSPERISDVRTNVLSIDKARQMLGWTPTTNLEVGLERMIDGPE